MQMQVQSIIQITSNEISDIEKCPSWDRHPNEELYRITNCPSLEPLKFSNGSMFIQYKLIQIDSSTVLLNRLIYRQHLLAAHLLGFDILCVVAVKLERVNFQR